MDNGLIVGPHLPSGQVVWIETNLLLECLQLRIHP